MNSLKLYLTSSLTQSVKYKLYFSYNYLFQVLRFMKYYSHRCLFNIIVFYFRICFYLSFNRFLVVNPLDLSYHQLNPQIRIKIFIKYISS